MSSPALHDSWPQVERLFQQALDLPPEDRAAFLEEACAGDQTLHKEVASLLAWADAPLTNLAQSIQFAASQLMEQPREGLRIGPWRVIRLLGQGGMGRVFLADRDDDQYHKQVAIKLMHTMLGNSPAMVLRFRAERQILARLEHPNIARLLDGGATADGLTYLVIEYVDGAPLDEYCRRTQPSLNERLQLFLQICDAVGYAHRYLVIHRDLKPSNILVTGDGTPKLLDFGVARLLDPSVFGWTMAQTRTSERMLTPEYASPEQIRGEPITTATDVFGLGLLLYEILAGRRPFQTEQSDPLAAARAICEQEPPPPSSLAREIPGDLDYVVLMALRKEPTRRYATVAQLCADIRAFLDGLPVSARTGTFWYRSGKFVRRHRVPVAAAMLFLVTLAGFSVGMEELARQASRARLAAERETDFLSSMFMASTPEEAAGRTITARDLLDRGAQRVDRDLASAPEVRAAMIEKIGLAYRSLGIRDQAMWFTRRAWQLKKQLYGQQNIETVATLETLAELDRDEGKFTQAEPLLRQVLAIREKKLGGGSDLVAEALGDLGECLFLEDKNTEAEALLHRSVGIYRASNNPNLVTPENYLALAIERQGSPAEAIQLLREAVDISRRKWGTISSNSAVSTHNLGGALMQIGDYVEGEAMTRQGAEIRRKILPPDHPDRLYSLHNLTYVLVKECNAAAAETTANETIEIALKSLGENHPRTALAYRNRGLVRELKRDYPAAAADYDKAFDILRNLNQMQSSIAAGVLSSYAEMQIDRGDFAGASENARKALDIFERVGGRDSPLAASALTEIGLATELAGHPADAEPLFRRALDIQRARTGPRTPIAIAAQVRLGESLVAEGKTKEAELLLRDAVYFVRHPPMPLLSWQRAEAESALGECLLERGRLGEAQAFFRSEPAKCPQAWWLRVDAQRRERLRKAKR